MKRIILSATIVFLILMSVFGSCQAGTRTCTACDGTGKCNRCYGTGWAVDGDLKCNQCDGTGNCPVCEGKGYINTGIADTGIPGFETLLFILGLITIVTYRKLREN